GERGGGEAVGWGRQVGDRADQDDPDDAAVAGPGSVVQDLVGAGRVAGEDDAAVPAPAREGDHRPDVLDALPEALEGRARQVAAAAGDDVVAAVVGLEERDAGLVQPGREPAREAPARRKQRAEAVHPHDRRAAAPARLGDHTVEPDVVAGLDPHEGGGDADRSGHHRTLASSGDGVKGKRRRGPLRSIISQTCRRALSREAFSGEEDAMLTHEENELITRIDPGTAMGTTMRRYWIPALLASELPGPDCPPVRVKLLGEDLVAFRDTEGRIGLLEELCPHRRASLFFGGNGEGGLRSVSPGGRFAAPGRCVDMMNEPEELSFKHKIHQPSSPTAEIGGVVWAYMGPPDLQPPLPKFAWTQAPAT